VAGDYVEDARLEVAVEDLGSAMKLPQNAKESYNLLGKGTKLNNKYDDCAESLQIWGRKEGAEAKQQSK
jgi:hypothetical protein